MRFSEKGPAIPDRLLEARDRGEVVFLCGAGVSMPAGLPDFAGLTRSVIDALGAPHDHPARGALGPLEPGASPVPFDQAFDLLERDYGATEVQAVVGELLGKPCPESRHHSVVSRLSTNPEGRPRIVTTNFDRLFHGVPPSRSSGATPPATSRASRRRAIGAGSCTCTAPLALGRTSSC